MHAKVRSRTVNDADYHRAKKGAFLFFEIRHGGLTFHDAKVCKPPESDIAEFDESDAVSYLAWHDHHGKYGRLHLNHGLQGAGAPKGDSESLEVPEIGSESDSDEDSDSGAEDAEKIGADAQWSYKEDDTGIHLRGNFARELAPGELFGIPSRHVVGHRLSFSLNLGVPAWKGKGGTWTCYTRDE